MGEWAGQPNWFIQKIWKVLISNLGDQFNNVLYQEKHKTKFGHYWRPNYDDVLPKLHTIRHDPHGRWKAGKTIHPVINNRTPQRFQFAPEIVCTGVQEIEIKHGMFGFKSVWIDGNIIGNFSETFIGESPVCTDLMSTIAINDGFDSVEQFFAYFNEDFKGKLIHWTDLKY